MKLILLFHPLSNGIKNFILATKYKSPLLYKIIIHDKISRKLSTKFIDLL